MNLIAEMRQTLDEQRRIVMDQPLDRERLTSNASRMRVLEQALGEQEIAKNPGEVVDPRIVEIASHLHKSIVEVVGYIAFIRSETLGKCKPMAKDMWDNLLEDHRCNTGNGNAGPS
jgi:hypothetical protein